MNKRLLLLVPPLAATAAAGVLVLASFGAWGAAASVEYPGWAPTAGGLLFGLPVGLVAVVAARRLLDATAPDFEVVPLQAWLSAGAFLSLASLLVAYTVTVGQATSYEAEYNSITGRYDPTFNLETFVFVSALLGAFFGAVALLATKHLSLNAISYAVEEVEGVDPVGSVMRS